MKWLLLLPLGLILFYGDAGAEIFIKKSPPDSPQAPPPAAPVETPPEVAAPPDIYAFARRYQKNCLSKQHPILQGEALQKLCGCSAAKIMETMRVEDIQAMATNTDEGRRQRDRMLLSVYVPCMEHPTQALIMHSCLNNPEIAGKTPNYRQICACAAGDTAAYVRRAAPLVVAESLRNNPDGTVDPLQALVNSPAYEAQTQQILMACLQKGLLVPAQP